MTKSKTSWYERPGVILAIILAIIAIGFSLSSCGLKENHETERGRGDTTVDHVNQGAMELGIEMADGYLNYGLKCVGVTGFSSSTKGKGDAGSIGEREFMDPFCLGVYETDGSINANQFDLYIEYQAAIASGNGEKAAALANELVANAPQEFAGADEMLR